MSVEASVQLMPGVFSLDLDVEFQEPIEDRAG
jgi:hypothetical protein